MSGSGITLFRAFVYLLLISIQLFFCWKTYRYLVKEKKARWLQTVTIIIFSLFTVPVIVLAFGKLHLFLFPRWFIVGCVYPFYLWHSSFVIFFVVWFLARIVRFIFTLPMLILKRFESTKRWVGLLKEKTVGTKFDQRRRLFLQRSFTATAGTIVAGSAYGALHTDKYEVNTVSIPINNLPAEFNGFSIGLISDIHSSVFMTKEQMTEYAGVMNDLKTDIITVTGDLVNSEADEVYPFAEAFSALKAPLGVYGVLGNHDFYTRKVDIVAQETEQAGIKLLRNQHILLERNSQKLALIGIDDTSSFRNSIPFFNSAIRGIEPGIPSLLMCHRPIFFDHASTRNVDLMLSGHTHGGQVVFGKIGTSTLTPAGLASRYIAGLYQNNGSQMYVSKGIGTVGVPFRLNCPPEVTKIILVKA